MDPKDIKKESFAEKSTKWIGSTSSIIVHTLLFLFAFSLILLGYNSDKVLLILTTLVSLEAIYLSIFIQMTVNRHTEELGEVSEDIEEIQENVEEIQEDVEGIEKDVEEIQEDVEEIQEDVEGIEKDVDEIQEDIEEIEEDNSQEGRAVAKSLNESDLLMRIEKLLEELKKSVEEKK